MELSTVAERISQKIISKGYDADPARIEEKLRRLVDEFGVPLLEAERSVMNEMAKEYNLSGFGTSSNERKSLNEVIPGEWVTIEGKVVALIESPSSAIAQSGVIADSTGAIRFVAWEKAHAPVMQPGLWYRLESAVIDEYRGVPNLKIHSGTTITEIEEDGALIPGTVHISDLTTGIGSVRAKMIQEWDVTHDRMLQSGLLGDETGTIKFVIWKEEGKEKLVQGTVYNIYYALVDEFNGRLSLNLNTATAIPEDGDIEVFTGEIDVDGAIVHIAPGSGLIKRCPVEGCNRVLSRQNYCPIHEMQPDFNYDLRIKGWLDNGSNTWEILIQREMVESLTGMSLGDARELAENNPLGMDEVFLRVRDTLLGRYIHCRGRDIDRRILVTSCEFLPFSPDELAALLNRAGGVTS